MALLMRSGDERIDVCDADLPGIEDGDPETTYILRPITKTVGREIEERYRKQVINRSTHQKDTVYDNEAIWLDKLDYALVSWTGVLVAGTLQPVPCEREFKDRALDLPRQIAILRLAGVNEVSRDERERSKSGAQNVR